MSVVLVVLAVIEAILIVLLVRRDRRKRYDGEILVYDTDEKVTFTLEITTDPEVWVTQDSVVLQVKPPEV